MPWTRRDGKHVFFQQSEPVSTFSALSATGASPQTLNVFTGSQQLNTWAEWGDAQSYQGIAPSSLPVVPATPETTRCAGVVTSQNQLQTDGVVFAWVLRRKRKLELSGLYSTSENGVPIGNAAIIQRGNFFVMARSKDDELQTLADKFKELTGI